MMWGTICHVGMQEYSETLVYTSTVDTWMSEEHARRLGTDEKFDIYI